MLHAAVGVSVSATTHMITSDDPIVKSTTNPSISTVTVTVIAIVPQLTFDNFKLIIIDDAGAIFKFNRIHTSKVFGAP